MLVRCPAKIFVCISVYVVFGFFFIRDFSIETFSWLTVVAISVTVFQRSRARLELRLSHLSVRVGDNSRRC